MMTLPFIAQLDSLADGQVLSGKVRKLTETGKSVKLVSVWTGLCIGGSAKVVCDGKLFEIKKNDFALFLTDHVLSQKEGTDDFVMMFTAMDFPFCLSLRQSNAFDYQIFFSRKPVVRLEPETARVIEHLMTVLNDIKYAEPSQQQSLIKSLSTFMSSLMHTKTFLHIEKEVRHPRPESIFQEFLTLVNKYFRESRKLSFYADKLCISTKYLSSAVGQITGRPATDWIDDVVMREARLLLDKDKAKDIKSVGDALGFSDQAAFTNYFKKHGGMTPMAYRKR